MTEHVLAYLALKHMWAYEVTEDTSVVRRPAFCFEFMKHWWLRFKYDCVQTLTLYERVASFNVSNS